MKKIQRLFAVLFFAMLLSSMVGAQWFEEEICFTRFQMSYTNNAGQQVCVYEVTCYRNFIQTGPPQYSYESCP